MFTYQLSPMITDEMQKGIAINGEENTEYAFDLNEFLLLTKPAALYTKKKLKKFLHALVTKRKTTLIPHRSCEKNLRILYGCLTAWQAPKPWQNYWKKTLFLGEYEIVLAAGDGKLDEDKLTIPKVKKLWTR